MSTFVSVGNATQPFPRLLEAVVALREMLPVPVVVQHGNTPFGTSGFDAVAFMGMDDFVARIREAKVLILHGGAGSVIQAIGAGRTPIVMPRRAKYGEHVDDHQAEFVEALGRAGRVIVANSVAELESAIRRAVAQEFVPAVPEAPLEPARRVAEVLRKYAAGS